MTSKFNAIVLMVFAVLVLQTGVEGREWKICQNCDVTLNRFCCQREEHIWKDNPQKKICCEFDEASETECKKNGDKCGQHQGVGNPTVNYGECCEGFKCHFPSGVVGAAGKCVTEDSSTMKPNTHHTRMTDPSTTPGSTPATTEATSQPVDPNCDQTLGNTGMMIVGNTLGITEMTDCDSSASYATKQFGMTLPEICETTIDTLLNKLPGEDAAKDQVRTLLENYGKDPATTKINEVCKCSCAKNSNGRAMCTPNGSSTFLNRCTKEKCCSGCCGQEPSGNQIRGFCTVCSQANCTPNGKSTYLNRCTKEKCCSGCCAQEPSGNQMREFCTAC